MPPFLFPLLSGPLYEMFPSVFSKQILTIAWKVFGLGGQSQSSLLPWLRWQMTGSQQWRWGRWKYIWVKSWTNIYRRSIICQELHQDEKLLSFILCLQGAPLLIFQHHVTAECYDTQIKTENWAVRWGLPRGGDNWVKPWRINNI